jgi:hypothetical protein
LQRSREHCKKARSEKLHNKNSHEETTRNERNGGYKIEYYELCKTVGKRITEGIQSFDCTMVRKTIENNRDMRLGFNLSFQSRLGVKGHRFRFS